MWREKKSGNDAGCTRHPKDTAVGHHASPILPDSGSGQVFLRAAMLRFIIQLWLCFAVMLWGSTVLECSAWAKYDESLQGTDPWIVLAVCYWTQAERVLACSHMEIHHTNTPHTQRHTHMHIHTLTRIHAHTHTHTHRHQTQTHTPTSRYNVFNFLRVCVCTCILPVMLVWWIERPSLGRCRLACQYAE